MNLNKLQDFLKRRRFLVLAGALAFFLIILILSFAASNKNFNPASENQRSSIPELSQPVRQLRQTNPSSTLAPNQSAELQKAIAEQMKVDQEYAGWQKSISDNYPWRKKLPLTSQNYYVYFDLSKKVFIGLLYPKAGDNVTQIKVEIIRQLREVKGIPVDNFTFEWTVTPQ